MIATIPQTEINDFAVKIGYSPQELLRQSLIAFIWSNLQDVKTEIFHIQKQYKIDKPTDFEKLYETGIIEEKDTWKDYQQFDHLFYKQEILETFLKQLA
jgi:hypothetical protein